jgi:DNA repair protein RecN (Recombination protein N)
LQLERERLAWQLTELDKLAPQPGEWEEVNTEHRRLSHSANLIDGVQGALGALSESDEAMITQLSSIVSKVRDLAEIDPALNDVLAALEPAEIQLQEAAYSLSHYAQKLELDPDRLAQVEKRLDALHSAARKFRLQPETLPEEHEARRAQLATLDAAADLDSLHAAEAKAREDFLTEAKKLSKARAKAGKALGAAVTTGMQELSMKGGSFEVALVQLPEGGAHGLEQVEFRVAGHAGVPLRPLDEVDTGIGGGVAEVVGRLLHQLGQQRQVLCVTHLPQVAARGDHHFQVAKAGNGKGGTVSSVNSLDKASRVEEVARMLGGLEITPTTRKHAKEMLAA